MQNTFVCNLAFAKVFWLMDLDDSMYNLLTKYDLFNYVMVFISTKFWLKNHQFSKHFFYFHVKFDVLCGLLGLIS